MPPKPPKRITPSYLENSALYYLQRFPASIAGLRRVLLGKVRRSDAHHGAETPLAGEWIEALIVKLTGLGYLDDTAFAEQKARGLFRRGGSTRVIRATLAAKGVGADLVDETLDGLKREEGDDLDLSAAYTLARRKRLGPFRPSDKRDDMKTKDLASLGRAGFSFDIARKVVEAEDVAALEQEIEDSLA